MIIRADTTNYSEGEIKLWELMTAAQGRTLITFRGLEFSYYIKGNELFISRKTKSITRSTVNIAYNAAVQLMKTEGYVSGPKKLGVFGSSYIYPIFVSIGIISPE